MGLTILTVCGPEAQPYFVLFFSGGVKDEDCVTLYQKFQNSKGNIYREHPWAWPEA